MGDEEREFHLASDESSGVHTKETWADCEDYVRILSRSCLRRAAQSHVESLISIIGNHSRGQSWDKVLTEISYKH